MISQELEISLHMAFMEARQARHEFITVEHLLLALLDNPTASDVLRACKANIEVMREELRTFIDQHTPALPGKEEIETQPTLGFQRVIQRTILHVQASSGKKEVTGANVLVAIFGEKDSHAVYYLEQQGVSRLDVVNYIAHGIRKGTLNEPEKNPSFAEQGKDSSTSQQNAASNTKESPLAQFAQNLNQLANEGKIDPLIGRTLEVERVIQVLCRRRKNNPLLVGEPGVGKTAIAEGLARLIIQGSIPKILANAVVYSLDIGSVLAGTKYRGDFEHRLKAIFKELKAQPQAILFIDEIHTLIGAGAASGGTLDASNLLKPILASGQLKCIGATTFTEYRSIFEKDAALSRRFQEIDVCEPTVEETVKILRGLKSRFEAHHGIKYSVNALLAAATLSARHITNRHLPDKAIDVIDEAGAMQHILPPSKRKKTIGKAEIEAIIAKIAKIPAKIVSTDDRNKLKNLERDLKSVVFGQDEAIDALVTSIKIARAGIGKEKKPIANILFYGPTGTGKTEAAQQLAFILGIELTRFDMSEYMEQHTVSRLIGAPPGYVGHDQPGLLTEAITKKPHSILLFDEIEKAHPDIFNLLLQVMDPGKLTDSNGRTADFTNAFIIYTTNAGAKALSNTPLGFTTHYESGDELNEIKRLFTPEFLNRIDAMIGFKPLEKPTIMNIVDKFLIQIEAQLHDKKVEISFSDALKEYLAKTGFDPKMGARPLQRLIQNTIRKALAEEILFGKLSNGGQVTVDIDGKDKIMLKFKPISPPNNTETTQNTICTA